MFCCIVCFYRRTDLFGVLSFFFYHNFLFFLLQNCFILCDVMFFCFVFKYHMCFLYIFYCRTVLFCVVMFCFLKYHMCDF